MAEVLFTDPALSQFSALDNEVRKRIVLKLKSMKEWPNHFLKPLKGSIYFSLRIGDYRAIIDWRKEREQLWVVAVGHRKNIYDKEL